MVEIDGSHGEGGGQIIRTSLSLAAITGKPVTIRNIRAGRPNPGLQMQHLTAAKAVRSICRGKLEGAELGSSTLGFEPGPIVGGRYEFNIGTAGSVTLVAQTLIPILLQTKKKSELRITGGTHVMKSPGYDYFENVFLPALECLEVKVKSRMLKAGYYPAGGGAIEVDIEPGKIRGCTFWPNEEIIRAVIRIAGLPESIAIREKKIFVQNEIYNVRIREDQSSSVGNSVTAWKGLRGSYVLGKKGKRAEVVAQEALDILRKEDQDVDQHLADQLLVYAALADGRTEYSTSTTTDHLKTNSEIIGKFIERELKVENSRVTCL